MSGGSYNYLCWAVDRDEMPGVDLDDLRSMHARLTQLDRGRYTAGLPELSASYGVAADRTKLVLDALETATRWAAELRDVWHAIEWRDSGDWSPDQADDAVREWAAKLVPERMPFFEIVLDSTVGQRTWAVTPIGPHDGTEYLTRISLRMWNGQPLLVFPFTMTDDRRYIRREPDPDPEPDDVDDDPWAGWTIFPAYHSTTSEEGVNAAHSCGFAFEVYAYPAQLGGVLEMVEVHNAAGCEAG